MYGKRPALLPQLLPQTRRLEHAQEHRADPHLDRAAVEHLLCHLVRLALLAHRLHPAQQRPPADRDDVAARSTVLGNLTLAVRAPVSVLHLEEALVQAHVAVVGHVAPRIAQIRPAANLGAGSTHAAGACQAALEGPQLHEALQHVHRAVHATVEGGLLGQLVLRGARQHPRENERVARNSMVKNHAGPARTDGERRHQERRCQVLVARSGTAPRDARIVREHYSMGHSFSPWWSKSPFSTTRRKRKGERSKRDDSRRS